MGPDPVMVLIGFPGGWLLFQSRQRTREVSPSPLTRQARREETSRRPEQGNPNALPGAIQAIACGILIAQMVTSTIRSGTIPFPDLWRDTARDDIPTLVASPCRASFFPFQI